VSKTPFTLEPKKPMTIKIKKMYDLRKSHFRVKFTLHKVEGQRGYGNVK